MLFRRSAWVRTAGVDGLAGLSVQGKWVVVPLGAMHTRSRSFTSSGMVLVAPGGVVPRDGNFKRGRTRSNGHAVHGGLTVGNFGLKKASAALKIDGGLYAHATETGLVVGPDVPEILGVLGQQHFQG